MSNPVTGLIGQAEAALADAARRTAARVAEPIRAKSQEVVAEVVGTASAAVRTVAIKVALGLVAAVMLTIAVVFALTALYWELLPQLGPVKARLVMAAAFGVIALVAIIAAAVWPKAKPPAKPAPAVRAIAAKQETLHVTADAAAVLDAPAPADGVPPADLAGGVEALASILGDAGFRREQAGLRAGLALAGQLKPMQIVALALIGGYVAGVRFSGRGPARD